MRKKTLAAFAAVYLTICLTYGAINGINMPVSSAEAEDITVTESVVTETQTMVTTQPPETVTEPPAETTTSARGEKKKRTKTTTVTEQPEEIPEEETEVQTAVPEAIPEELMPEQTEVTEQQTEEYTEAPAAVPTLEEYLSKLRCGGCHHGCYLSNPRCMRGARKQSQAESEYYSLYG